MLDGVFFMVPRKRHSLISPSRSSVFINANQSKRRRNEKNDGIINFILDWVLIVPGHIILQIFTWKFCQIQHNRKRDNIVNFSKNQSKSFADQVVTNHQMLPMLSVSMWRTIKCKAAIYFFQLFKKYTTTNETFLQSLNSDRRGPFWIEQVWALMKRSFLNIRRSYREIFIDIAWYLVRTVFHTFNTNICISVGRTC